MFVTFMTIYSYIIILLTEWDIVLHFYSQLLGTCQRHAVAPQWPGCTDRRWITLRLSVRDLILKIQRQFKCEKAEILFHFLVASLNWLINQPSTHHQDSDEILLNPRLLFLLQGWSWKIRCRHRYLTFQSYYFKRNVILAWASGDNTILMNPEE